MSSIRKKDQLVESPDSTERAKKKNVTKPIQSHQEVLEEVMFHARLLWNRGGFLSRTCQAEDRDFREFFGCGPLVATDLWVLIRDHDVLPSNSSINKLLWTLRFMKNYSTENQLCSTVKVSNKLFRETCWSFIEAIASLQHEVVSTKIRSIYLQKLKF